MRKESRQALKGVIVVAAVLAVVLAERRYQLSAYVSAERIDAWLTAAGPLAPLVFIMVMALAVVVSPIPSLPLDILAGKVFGPLPGTLYAALGALLGAVMSFQIARVLGRDVLARFLKGHINFCPKCSDKLLTRVVFLARLVPFVSFDLVSYGAGLTRMSLGKFAVASFLGMLPLTFLYTSYGALMFENRAVTWIGGVVMVVLFFLVPLCIERYDLFSMRRHFAHEEADGPTSRNKF